jgi:transcriptional regulator with XRE-family HTH domain
MQKTTKTQTTTIGVNNYVEHSMSILDRINELLLEKLDGKQSELAKKLNKNESEISKWLSGIQNFTLFTISKLEEAFGEPIIAVCTHYEDVNSTFIQCKTPYKTSSVNLAIGNKGELEEQLNEFETISISNLPKELKRELPA